jgi:hypothetical protein
MALTKQEKDYYRDRAEREIAIAEATGAKAYASVDHRTVFIERRDGTSSRIRIPAPQRSAGQQPETRT